MTSIRRTLPLWMRGLFWRVFGHPLRGREMWVENYCIGTIQNVRGNTVTFKPSDVGHKVIRSGSKKDGGAFIGR